MLNKGDVRLSAYALWSFQNDVWLLSVSSLTVVLVSFPNENFYLIILSQGVVFPRSENCVEKISFAFYPLLFYFLFWQFPGHVSSCILAMASLFTSATGHILSYETQTDYRALPQVLAQETDPLVDMGLYWAPLSSTYVSEFRRDF